MFYSDILKNGFALCKYTTTNQILNHKFNNSTKTRIHVQKTFLADVAVDKYN